MSNPFISNRPAAGQDVQISISGNAPRRAQNAPSRGGPGQSPSVQLTGNMPQQGQVVQSGHPSGSIVRTGGSAPNNAPGTVINTGKGAQTPVQGKVLQQGKLPNGAEWSVRAGWKEGTQPPAQQVITTTAAPKRSRRPKATVETVDAAQVEVVESAPLPDPESP